MKNKFYFFRLFILLFICTLFITQFNISQNTAGNSENLPSVLKPDEIYSKYRDAIVYVFSYDEDGELLNFGSGVIVSPDGIIYTNYHVIDGAESIKIKKGESVFDTVKIAALNMESDAAILKINLETNVFITPGDCANFSIGEEVYTFGNPRGLERTIAAGIISGKRELYGQMLIQFDAGISPGSSGGALISKYGKLLGITCSAYENTQNLNFAVPVSEFKKMLVFDLCDTLLLNRLNELWFLYLTEQVSNSFNSVNDSLINLLAGECESNIPLLMESARYYSCFKNFDKAAGLYSKAIELDPGNSELYLMRSGCYKGCDSVMPELTDLNTAILYSPRDSRLYLKRAECYKYLKQYHDAAEDYSMVISLRPDYYDIYLDRAECFIETGLEVKAESDLRKSIWTEYKDYYSYVRRARLFERLYNYRDAVMDYTQALTLWNDKELYLSRALLFSRMELYREAISDYCIYLPLNPNSALVLNNLGYCCLGEGDLEQAEKYFRKAIVSDKNHFDSFLGLAIIYFKQNNKRDMFIAMTDAIKCENRISKGVYGLIELKERGFFWSRDNEDTLIKIFEMVGIEKKGDPSNKRAVRSESQDSE